MLIAGISLEALATAMGRITRGNMMTASLLGLRENGFVLVDARPRRVLQPLAPGNEIVRRLLAGEEGVLQSTGDTGQAVLSAYTQVLGIPWGVVIQQDTVAAFAPVEALSRQAQVWLALALIVATTVRLVLARQITRPLAQLRHAANAFAAGDLSQRLAFMRRDEIGGLGNAFDAMASSLAEYTERLEEANRDLELQIGERQQAELGVRRAMADLSSSIRRPNGRGPKSAPSLTPPVRR